MGFISPPLSEEVTKFEEFRKITIFANIIDNYLEFQYLSVSHLKNYETRKILNFWHFFSNFGQNWRFWPKFRKFETFSKYGMRPLQTCEMMNWFQMFSKKVDFLARFPKNGENVVKNTRFSLKLLSKKLKHVKSNSCQ